MKKESIKRFYSFETSFLSLKTELSVFLKQNNIYYELSGCRAAWHFDVLCDDATAEKVDSFLDGVSICGVRA